MDALDYCDLCDLPKSQCVHGQPPPAPPEKAVPPPATPRKRAAAPKRVPAEKPLTRRWTTPEAFKPLILEVLAQAGGTLDADELFRELEAAAQDRFLAGDRESTPGGELRWQYAARRARIALIEEGRMTKTRPGVWQVAD